MVEKYADLILAFAKRKKSLAAAEWAMEWLGIMCFGVEGADVGSHSFRYVNRGYTYEKTIIRHAGDYHIGSWGDLVEELELNC